MCRALENPFGCPTTTNLILTSSRRTNLKTFSGVRAQRLSTSFETKQAAHPRRINLMVFKRRWCKFNMSFCRCSVNRVKSDFGKKIPYLFCAIILARARLYLSCRTFRRLRCEHTKLANYAKLPFSQNVSELQEELGLADLLQ